MKGQKGIKNNNKKTAPLPRAKVFVGMSGGVDSSVSAALLKDQGYDVTGVFIKVWQADFLPCNWREERLDAMRVAAKLGIPFLTIDLAKEYKQEVVDYMISEYKAGRTPNPDVMCNRYVKFGAFWEKAKKMGADYIATGHYAQVGEIRKSGKNSSARSEEQFEMRASADKEKDQTYFLWTLTQKDLAHVLFPIGYLEKSQVRKLAERYSLPTADKKDSQGLCFLGHVDIKDFLKHYLKAKQGKVLNEKAEQIGTHEGIYFYTIGQRHGFSISKKTTGDRPLYVISKDVKKNTLTVSENYSASGSASIGSQKIILERTSWIEEPQTGKGYLARIRYRQKLQSCKILIMKKGSGKNGKKNSAVVFFPQKQDAVSLGQSLVLYSKDGKRCLGGGVISAV